MQDQLEINRTGHQKILHWPTWINLLAVALAIVLIFFFSIWTVYQSELTLKENVESKLKTILKIECEAVQQWVKSEKQLASVLTSNEEFSERLLALDSEPTSNRGLFRKDLARVADSFESKDCLLVKSDMTLVADFGDSWLVDQMSELKTPLQEAVRSEKPVFSKLIKPKRPQPIDAGVNETNKSFAFIIVVPVKHASRGVVGCIAIAYDADTELTSVIGSSRTGETGETIALTDTGRLVSKSRFENSSEGLGSYRDSNGATVQWQKTTADLEARPLRDSRGVEAISVAHWMPSLGIALVTKMDRSEAYAPVIRIRRFMWILFGLLTLTSVSTAFYRWRIYRLRQLAKQSDLERKRLGAYELEEKLGEGGMGVVYRAKHALMRRPTAIKILPPEKSNQASIERFEREVKYTSQLKHPNTISIYDYGRTKNGLFYYAMELLDGLNLEQLVRSEGPLVDGRVVLILQQVCQSLHEAHSMGLIHRDIKPANIMLCDRGGAADTIKVLDFGMVRDRTRASSEFNATLSGTPVYMAPECFADPAGIDFRVDIFAVGAVGFYLLTGKSLMEATSLNELRLAHEADLSKTTHERLQRVARNSDRPIASTLVDLIARCVAIDRDKRVSSVAEAIEELSRCLPCFPWDHQCAREWWQASAEQKDGQETRDDIAPNSLFHMDETQAFSVSDDTTKRDPDA